MQEQDCEDNRHLGRVLHGKGEADMLGMLFLVAERRYYLRVMLCRLGNKGKVGSAREC